MIPLQLAREISRGVLPESDLCRFVLERAIRGDPLTNDI